MSFGRGPPLIALCLLCTACSAAGKASTATTTPTHASPAPASTATSTAPTAAATTTTTLVASFDPAAVAAAGAALAIPSLDGTDPVGADLLNAMGVPAALGDDAEAILARVDDAAQAANSALPGPPESATAFASRRRRDNLVDFMWMHVRDGLAGILERGSRGGPPQENVEEDPPRTTTANGVTTTDTLTTTMSAAGSLIKLKYHLVRQVVATDAATGTSVLDSTNDVTVTGTMDVCPSTAGLADATVSTVLKIDATTYPGPRGRVGTHAVGSAQTSSHFQGQVDDTANLGKIGQDFQKASSWKTSASADGGPTFAHDGSIDLNFTGLNIQAEASGAPDLSSFDASGLGGDAKVTGDGTQQMINDSIGNAAIDIITIGPSYQEAQRLWQHGRCVVVVATDYNAETPLPLDFQNSSQHTEAVDAGSQTAFAAKLKQRFQGSVQASMQTELVQGDKSLEPQSLPSGEGTITYTAGDEDDKDATVKLSSTSKRGIGTLVLTFHTGKPQITVTINGTENFEGIIDLTMAYSPVTLTLQPYGSYSGRGTSTVTGSYGPCADALTETGDFGLTATQDPDTNGTPGPWHIAADTTPNNSHVVFSCQGDALPGVDIFNGVGSDFVHDLATIDAPGAGGTVTVAKDGTYGPVNATVAVAVSGQ